jgi:anti-sigma regulatory factor (Ser/Thr protein kinase)
MPASSALRWTRTFPARADQIGEARRFLAHILDGLPGADDAILCVSELATNAVIHSNSQRPGGSFSVRAGIRHGGCLRVEVEDQGGPWGQPVCADGQHGRGLLIVGRLACDWGVAGDSQAGWTIWFVITASGPCGQDGQDGQHGQHGQHGQAASSAPLKAAQSDA